MSNLKVGDLAQIRADRFHYLTNEKTEGKIVVNQANDLLERISDIESRLATLESKLSFIVVRGDASDPEIEFVGGD